MNYLCQPITPDSMCAKCLRYTDVPADDVFVAAGSSDANCGYLGPEQKLDLRPLVFKTYEEP